MSIVEIKTRRGLRRYSIIEKIVGIGRVILITRKGNAIEVSPKKIVGEWEI